MQTTRDTNAIVTLVLKAVAVAMGIAVIVFNVIGVGTPGTHTLLLAIGLAALGIVAIR
jgi:hypothetical protein